MNDANCKSDRTPIRQFAICNLRSAFCSVHLAILLLACWPGAVRAQFESTSRVTSVYPDISIEAATHLRTASSYVSDQNWVEAVDLYHKLIERFGDKVVQVGSRPLYVTVRDYCHMQLAAMPTTALAHYRQRVDAQAEALFRSGVRERDRDQLASVVEQAFASSWGDNALDALAEIAFEAGDFDQAWIAWSRIYRLDHDGLEPDGVVSADLTYPDTDLDRPLIEAKQILCQIFLGRRDWVAQAIVEYRGRHATARGFLGGTEGVLADRLAVIARETAQTPASDDDNWVTFAGNAQRTKVVAQAIDIGSVQWSAPLPQVQQTRISFNTRAVTNTSDDLLSYHPLVFRDQVIVSGREEVRAYDLQEGPKGGNEPIWTFRRDIVGQPSVMASRPSSGSPQYTLTAHRGRLYVRMGAPETTLPIRRGGQPDSSLVSLDLAADGKELWRIQPEPAEPDLAFEGSPLVADDNVYIGVTRGGAMTHSFLACYDAATGAKKWRTLICESSATTSFFNAGSISHNLPTLGGGMVFYNTNLGAVAAVDQRTGRIRWIATYSRKGREDPASRSLNNTHGRELSPCIYHNGLVFALPADGEGVHAFDAMTGELRWRTPEPPNFAHMLGVAHGNLICTGNQVVAIDVATGKRAWQWSDSANMAPFGRGTLAGDLVYFPTKTHVYMLDQRTGVLAKPKEVGALQERHNQSPGNLVIGDGYLVVAQPKGLTVFCQYDVLINRYRELIAANPSDPDPHLRLARAAEASGSPELAVEHYRATIELASADGTEVERATRLSARTQLYAMLQQLARKTAEGHDWSRAEGHLREAATVAPTLQGKLDVLLLLAEIWNTARDGAKAVAVYQDILADDSLRALGVAVDGNRTVRADVEIAGRVQGLFDEYGRDIYARYERAAVEMLAEALQSASVPTAERLLRTHPNADAAAHALLYLANQYTESKQFASASAAYKQILARRHTPQPTQVAALYGLAQLHEAQQAFQVARGWWHRLANEFPHAAMPNRPEQSVASFVQEHLGRPPYEPSHLPADERLKLPLTRRWNRLWDEQHRMLVPAGTPPAELGLLLIVSDMQSVDCLAMPSGDRIWHANLPGPIRWAAFLEDRLLVAADSHITCVASGSGEVFWQQKASAGPQGFSEFHRADNRLLVREDARRLACLAADSGAILWTYEPTHGSIQPHTFFSSQHVALRTKQPSRFVVLDGEGRRRFEPTQAGDAWEYPPVAIDANRLCFASDARTIQLVDLTDGKQVWSFVGPNSDQRPIPIVGPGSLLVLVSGNTLVRLDPETGRSLWTSRVSDDVLPPQGTSWAVDGQLFYCITRELNLRTFRLTDGTLAWEQFLTGPGDQWQLAVTDGQIVALPRRPHASDGLPVVICRQSDGRLLQRLFFKPHGNEAIVYLNPQHTLVGSEREVWVLAKQD
jgi:outer membrane protein assembly factor BamB